MKNFGRFALTISLAFVLILSAAAFAFADGGGLQIVKTYPVDGASNLQPQNVAVKMSFNEGVSKNQAENAAKFSVVKKEDGETQPIRVIYSSENEGELLVLLENTLEPKTDYVFTLQAGFISDNGDELAEDCVINFKVRDTQKDGTVNMILMLAMMGVIMLFSVKAQKNQQQKQEDKSGKTPEKVNPYKEAKKSGKSVEEIVKEDQKQKAKAAERKAKAAAKLEKELAEFNFDEEETLPVNTYRVHKKHPISEGGSTYVTGRKAAAEAAAKEKAAKGTTNPKKKGKKK